jgi:STE24 endopeptidase
MPGQGEESRARRYHGLRYGLFFAALAAAAAFLLFELGRGPGGLYAAAAARFPEGPARLAAYLAAFHLVLYAVQAPFRWARSWALERAFGLSAEPLGRWIGDEAKAGLLGFALLAPLVGAFYALVGAVPRGWWLPAALAWAALSAFLAWVFPRLVLPLFYPLRPLREGELRARLLAVASRAGVPARGIYEIALSRKTRKANAAVVGIGSARRIVLGDTLLEAFSPGEIETVLAHELGHEKRRHAVRILAGEALFAAAGLWALERLSEPLAAAFSARGIGDPALYPALLLLAGLYGFALLPLRNAWSRCLEREADRFALELTGEGAVFASALGKLADMNLALRSPGRLVRLLFYTHPPMVERIRAALAFAGPKKAPPGGSSA